MNPVYEKLNKCYNIIREKTDFVPEIALVLGSGLNKIAEKAEIYGEIPYNDIEGFPISTVEGHEGKYIFGRLGGKNIVIMQGRVHYYEGYNMNDVVLPIRIMGLMGAKKLILTNAVGGIRSDLNPGDLMAVCDQISSFVPSPLIGENIDELGTRFPDMSEIYSKRLISLCMNAAKETGTELKEGIYLQTSGPNYESPAEIRMYKTLGADVVGMSTACEAIAANHIGMEICAISCITNHAAGISKNKLTHEEVKETGLKANEKISALIIKLIKKM